MKETKVDEFITSESTRLLSTLSSTRSTDNITPEVIAESLISSIKNHYNNVKLDVINYNLNDKDSPIETIRATYNGKFTKEIVKYLYSMTSDSPWLKAIVEITPNNCKCDNIDNDSGRFFHTIKSNISKICKRSIDKIELSYSNDDIYPLMSVVVMIYLNDK